MPKIALSTPSSRKAYMAPAVAQLEADLAKGVEQIQPKAENRSPATRTYRLRGDWMRDGYIDNLGRTRALDVLVMDGCAYDPDLYGLPDDEGRMILTADDEISAWGASITFSPDGGELDRVGRHVFAQPDA